MKTIRWGILGCGDVTEVKSGPAFNKVPQSRLTAVMRRDGEKAADYARRHGVDRWYDSADALIGDGEVDAVYIATPPGSHCELALKVAAAGKPCYVEKPMARNAAECEQMGEAFAAADRPLFVAYYRRGLAHFAAVKSMIESGRYGALKSLRYRFANGAQLNGTPDSWRYQPEISGGGLFWDLGSHALDLFDWWLGPLRSVSGHALRQNAASPVEELVAMTAIGGADVSLSADWNFISHQEVDCVLLEFEKAQISCAVFGPPELRIEAVGEESQILNFSLPENIQYHLIENSVAHLLGGTPALSTGQSATRTSAVIDQVASIS
jgi:predicted dehydrogenase